VLSLKVAQLGRLTTSIYDFPEAGDVLPMHSHDATTVHITIVARGRFRMHGDGWAREASAGDVIDWQPNDPHEFVALEPGGRLVNINKA